MQLITEKTEILETLRSVSRGLVADKSSWCGWHVIAASTHPVLPTMRQGRLATEMRELLENHDGMVLWFENGQCLAIVHEVPSLNIGAFSQALNEALHTERVKVDVNAFPMSENTHQALICLSRYRWPFAGEVTRSVDAVDPSSQVNHYNDLRQLWPQICYHRETRRDPHVMIVDDDELTRHIIAHSLKQDYALLTAANATEAVRKHILHAPNIIFLDIDLPDYDGFSLLKHFQKNDPLCRVVMFSSNHFLTNRLKAFAAGASGFMPKPFDRRKFKTYIQSSIDPDTQIRKQPVGV